MFQTSSRNFHVCQNLLKKLTTNKLKTKTKDISSQIWLSRQLSDPYVEKAKMMNLRCRSAFKLIEIDDKFKILEPGQFVIDCGAAPGSWTQVAVKRVNSDGSNKNVAIGKVVSVDKQHFHEVEGATVLGNMDFTTEKSQQILQSHLHNNKVNVVLSDMAPAASGVRQLDNENMLKLCYSALRFALQNSALGASFLVKMWQCGETKQFELDINKFYNNVKIIKPKSSRSDSAEIFLLGKDFKGIKT